MTCATRTARCSLPKGLTASSCSICPRRYVVMGEGAFMIVTIWVAHVFAFAAAEFTLYFGVTSATKRSGNPGCSRCSR